MDTRTETAPIRGFAEYVCYAGCDRHYPLDELRYRCESCGGLLDVRHDLDLLAQVPGASWRARFDERLVRAPLALRSGVWSRREWVCPQLDDSDIVSLAEGYTPLLPAPGLGRALGAQDLLVKQCGQSHTGSFKDLGMTVLVSMVQRMRRLGHNIPAVACASTGDTSAALAAYAARAGIPAIVFLPAGKISDEQLTQPIANYAITASLQTDFDGCMRLVAAFCERHGVYLANSMNPLRIEGQKTISVEICQQLGWEVPDVVIVPGGNLGNVTAIGKGFALLRRLGVLGADAQARPKLPRLIVAQAANAAPLYHAFKRGWRYEPLAAQATQASAIQIGAPVNVHKAIATLRACDGLVDIATEDELAAACGLADRHGLYADPHTGVALAVLRRLCATGEIRPTDRVVVISTAHGLKFSGLKRSYHQAGTAPDRLDGALPPSVSPSAVPPNRPLALAADLDQIERVLLPLLARGTSGN